MITRAQSRNALQSVNNTSPSFPKIRLWKLVVIPPQAVQPYKSLAGAFFSKEPTAEDPMPFAVPFPLCVSGWCFIFREAFWLWRPIRRRNVLLVWRRIFIIGAECGMSTTRRLPRWNWLLFGLDSRDTQRVCSGKVRFNSRHQPSRNCSKQEEDMF